MGNYIATPQDVSSFSIPCIQGFPDSYCKGIITASAFCKTDSMGKQHTTINFTFDGANSDPEIVKTVADMLKNGFDTTMWISVNSRAGLKGEYILYQAKSNLDNVVYEGFNYSCTKNIKSVYFTMDQPGGLQYDCKNYKCLANTDFSNKCDIQKGSTWKPNLSPVHSKIFNYDMETMQMTWGITKPGCQANTQKLYANYSMHTGWLICPKDSNCNKILLGRTSGHFNFDVTGLSGASTLTHGTALAVCTLALLY